MSLEPTGERGSRPGGPDGSRLVLGPLLRYVGTTTATVWVEVDGPCVVQVLDTRAETFQVHGHHYALVVLEGLAPGSDTAYDVRLDGERVWPPADGRPAPLIRTRAGERECRLIFGSCRVVAPMDPPHSLPPSEHRDGKGIDALWAYSRQLQTGGTTWPDGLLLLGDQVYVDDVSPETMEFIRGRRDVEQAPGETVADFEEYTRLYRESWSEPDIRWLLSTVPSAMIFDDHEVSDDWNISSAWIEERRALPWWDARITGAFTAYWVYQHLGNLSPPEIAQERLFAQVQQDDDAGPRLRELARRWDRETASSRWAYYRDFGRSRVLVIDSRAARVLTDGHRDMVGAGEWAWIADHARGDFDHLVIATTLPVFLPHGIHHLESWNEALCAGAWGGLAARLSEKLRRACDLEHWAAFHQSFEQLVDLVRSVSRGSAGRPPATITILGGDVHTTYVAEVAVGRDPGESRVYQIVCSPFRNPMAPGRRRVVNAAGARGSAAVLSRLARWARVPPPSARWRYLSGRSYDNSIGELVLDRRAASVSLRRAVPGSDPNRLLEPVMTHRLSGSLEAGGRGPGG